jgi:signal transduction histidine kinase
MTLVCELEGSGLSWRFEKAMTEIAGQVEKLFRQQEVIARFGSFALRERDIVKILREAARGCAEGLDVSFSKVFQYRSEHNDFLVVAGHGWQQEVIGQVVARAELTMPQRRVFTTGEPMLCHDLPACAGNAQSAFYARHRIVSTIDVLIRGSDLKPYGLIEIANQQLREYHQYDLHFLIGFSSVLAEAVLTISRAAALQRVVDRMKAMMEEKDHLLAERAFTALRLRQAENMEDVGQMTGIVAHDLNNILTVILGTSEILAESVADRPKVAAIAKMIDAAAVRGADLTKRLLASARRSQAYSREIDLTPSILDAANRSTSLGE